MRSKCIFCEHEPAYWQGLTGHANSFSLEHGWPEALGGKLCNDLFKTGDVCMRCNNLAGQWVDGAFIRSWFTTNEISISAQEFLDPATPAAIPLVFLGELPEFATTPEEVCELWTAPAGSQVYHVRPKHEPVWFGYAGGEPKRRKDSNPDRAYLVLATPNEYWARCDLLSFTAQFDRSKRFCLTDIDGLSEDESKHFCPPADPDDERQRKDIRFIRDRTDALLGVRASIRVDYSHRFLTKVALVLGFRLLGEPFLASSYAQALRQALGERDPQRRREISVRGTDFFNAEMRESIGKLLTIRGAWVLLVQPTGKELCLVVCTPMGHVATIVVSDDPGVWHTALPDDFRSGGVFVIQPQQKLFEGPISLPIFIAHQVENFPIRRLVELERKRVSLSDLPPKK